jgi:rSAM/selenodomain-associated transferase 1
MLGVFAKIPGLEPVKTRLQSRLDRAGAERFHMASLADTLETACRVVDAPVLFLSAWHSDPGAAHALLKGAGLEESTWNRVHVAGQHGAGLGARIEAAFVHLATGGEAALLLGSDSPALGAAMIRRGLDALMTADVVLGPADDGGYWSIGVRTPVPGLLDGIPWSAADTFAATRARAAALGLEVTVLDAWTDVDHPEDLDVLARQILALRAAGDTATARHSERVLRALGILGA